MDEKIRAKLDRSLAAVLGMGEQIELGGETWTLFPLTGIESVELRAWTKKYPAPPPKQETEEWNTALLFYVLWLSLRKDGLTPQEIRACHATHEWALTEDDVKMLVPLDRLEEIVEQVFRFLGIRVVKDESPEQAG